MFVIVSLFNRNKEAALDQWQGTFCPHNSSPKNKSFSTNMIISFYWFYLKCTQCLFIHNYVDYSLSSYYGLLGLWERGACNES